MENQESIKIKDMPVIKKQKTEKDLKYQRDKDRESVKGIFRFYEIPGGVLSFCFKAYKEDPIESYSLLDGQVYTIPLGVAKHLNKSGWYPQYSFIPGEKDTIGAYSPDGQVMKVTKKVRRYGFQSLEFVDIEGLEEASGLVEVTKAAYY